MGGAHAGDTDARAFFARRMVVRTEMGWGALPGVPPRPRPEPLFPEPEAAEQQIPRDHGSVRSAGNQALHRRRRNRHVRRWNHQLREAATTYSDRAPVGRSSPQGPGAALSFDLLYLDHYDTRQIPLQYRKDVLRDTFDFQDPLQFTEQREREGEAYDRQACRRVGRA